MRRFAKCALLALPFFFAGCKQEPPAPALNTLKPKPLPELPAVSSAGAATDAGVDARERLFQVEAAPVYGDALPKDAIRVELAGESVRVGGAPFDPTQPEAAQNLKAMFPEGRAALIVTDADTYLAQAAPLFAALDDARVPTFLLHPSGKVAFPVTFSDEKDFQHWLDEVTLQAAGRVRIIHREDGYELQTVLGKLAGGDPNGPSVPRRGGHYDVARLRAALVALKGRFKSDTESCIVPSYGMEIASVAETLTAYYPKPEERLFDAICFVYPRPQKR